MTLRRGAMAAGNINATLKSGTSSPHGDLWEYFRNTSLDATDHFLKRVVIQQNIFGGHLGGPVGPKAKLGYFYVNYQGTRQRSGASPVPSFFTGFIPCAFPLLLQCSPGFSGTVQALFEASVPLHLGRRHNSTVELQHSAPDWPGLVCGARLRWDQRLAPALATIRSTTCITVTTSTRMVRRCGARSKPRWLRSSARTKLCSLSRQCECASDSSFRLGSIQRRSSRILKRY
jgi:hypothetical protein